MSKRDAIFKRFLGIIFLLSFLICSLSIISADVPSFSAQTGIPSVNIPKVQPIQSSGSIPLSPINNFVNPPSGLSNQVTNPEFAQSQIVTSISRDNGFNQINELESMGKEGDIFVNEIKDYILESRHPYLAETFKLEPGKNCKQIRFHFEKLELDYWDSLEIYYTEGDKPIATWTQSSSKGDDFWSEWFTVKTYGENNFFRLKINKDAKNDQYGFRINKIDVRYTDTPPGSPYLAETFHPYAYDFENTWELEVKPEEKQVRFYVPKMEIGYWEKLILLSAEGNTPITTWTQSSSEGTDFWTKWDTVKEFPTTGKNYRLKFGPSQSGDKYGFIFEKKESRMSDIPIDSPYIAETHHPCATNFLHTWEIVADPKIDQMRFHFEKLEIDYWDKLELFAAEGNKPIATWTQGSSAGTDFWTGYFPGNSFKFKLTTSNNDKNYWGFRIDKTDPPISKPKTGSLSLDSTPQGAAIYITNVNKGVTPAVIGNLPIGECRFVLKLNNYQDYFYTVNILADQITYHIATLMPSPTDVTYSLTIHDGSTTGPVLPDVQIHVVDGKGAVITGVTDSSGFVQITGSPGTWSVQASKNEYKSSTWNEDLSASKSSTRSLNRIDPQDVTFSLTMHDGSTTGPVLPDVQIRVVDGKSAVINGVTDSSGFVQITGSPGIWQVSASKSDYQSRSWNQDLSSSGAFHEYLEPNNNYLSVVTLPATEITKTSAIVRGQLTNTGGLPCTVWIENSRDQKDKKIIGNYSTINNPIVFSSRLYDLKPGTTYSYTAYAQNTAGISNGETLSFTTINDLETGSISVVSTPSGASIWLDGIKTDKPTPHTLPNIPSGPHTVLLKLNEYKDYSTTIEVISGQTTEIVAKFVPNNLPKQFSQSETSNSDNLQVDGVFDQNGDITYIAQWNNGALGKIEVNKWDSAGVVLKRSDESGTKKGLTATYAGVIQGNRIVNGIVSWTWNGVTTSGTWNAVWEESELIINSLNPSSKKAGDQAFVLSIIGSGFTKDSVCLWNGQERVTTFISSSELHSQITSNDIANPAEIPVLVKNKDQTGKTSNTLYFKVENENKYLEGVDISHHQSINNNNWGKARDESGIRFVFIRSSYGSSLTDSNFVTFMGQIRSVGDILVGAYHCRGYWPSSMAQNSGAVTQDALSEATKFLSVVRPSSSVDYLKVGDLRPVIDFEIEENKDTLNPQWYSLWLKTWIQEVEKRTSIKPIVYTSDSFVQYFKDIRYADGSKLDFWVARYNIIEPANDWRFWQYSGTGKVVGIAGNGDGYVDRDRYKGTFEELKKSDLIIKSVGTNPIINSVTPSSSFQENGVKVKIEGSNFGTGAKVQLIGSSKTISGSVRFNNGSAIECTFNLGSAPFGDYDLRVLNKDGSSGVWDQKFQIVQYKSPVITLVTPSSSFKDNGVKVKIEGSNFGTGAKVQLIGSAKTISGSVRSNTGSAIECTFNLGSAPFGDYDLRVLNKDGSSGVWDKKFQIVQYKSPVITLVTPSSSIKENGVKVKIEGSNFGTGAKVQLAGSGKTISGSVRSNAGSAIECTFNLGSAPFGDYDLRVLNKDGSSGVWDKKFQVIENSGLVTYTLKLTEGKKSGPVLPNVKVIVKDGNGIERIKYTDSLGVVQIEGYPGIWDIRVNKPGYELISWKNEVLKSQSFTGWLNSISHFKARKVLEVPYIHQHMDTDGDFNGDWACAPTSAVMVLGYHGILPKKPIKIIGNGKITPIKPTHWSDYGSYVSQEYSYNNIIYTKIPHDEGNYRIGKGAWGYIWKDGMNDVADNLIEFFELHNLKATANYNIGSDKVKKIIVEEINANRPVIARTYLTSKGHYVVIVGYEIDKNDKITYLVNDPNSKFLGVSQTVKYTFDQMKLDAGNERGLITIKN